MTNTSFHRWQVYPVRTKAPARLHATGALSVMARTGCGKLATIHNLVAEAGSGEQCSQLSAERKWLFSGC